MPRPTRSARRRPPAVRRPHSAASCRAAQVEHGAGPSRPASSSSGATGRCRTSGSQVAVGAARRRRAGVSSVGRRRRSRTGRREPPRAGRRRAGRGPVAQAVPGSARHPPARRRCASATSQHRATGTPAATSAAASAAADHHASRAVGEVRLRGRDDLGRRPDDPHPVADERRPVVRGADERDEGHGHGGAHPVTGRRRRRLYAIHDHPIPTSRCKRGKVGRSVPAHPSTPATKNPHEEEPHVPTHIPDARLGARRVGRPAGDRHGDRRQRCRRACRHASPRADSTPVPSAFPDGYLMSYVLNAKTGNPGQTRLLERAVVSAPEAWSSSRGPRSASSSRTPTARPSAPTCASTRATPLESVGATRTAAVSEGTPEAPGRLVDRRLGLQEGPRQARQRRPLRRPGQPGRPRDRPA